MTTLITLLADHFHHISLLSLQFPMSPFFTMLHDACHHNAPWLLLSQCSRTLVITVLHDLCHHKALCRFSSQFSKTTLITMLADHFHSISLLSLQFPIAPFFKMLHDACQHNAPWILLSECSRILVDRKSVV